MNKPIYKWSGQYWGFISNSKLFDSKSNYKGWVHGDNQVWDKNGNYVGEIVDDNYILRRSSKISPVSGVPKVTPVTPVSPVPKVNKVGRVKRAGWIDPLENL
jgi:hypothetical protein